MDSSDNIVAGKEVVVSSSATASSPATVTESYASKRARVECDDEKIGMHVTILQQALSSSSSATSGVKVPPRFKASTKDLYSDFVVREVPLENNGVPLTLKTVGGASASNPVAMSAAENRAFKREQKQQEADAAAALAADPEASAKMKAEIVEKFAPIIGDEKASAMGDAIVANEATFTIGVVSDKEKRGLFHNTVKKEIGTKYISTADSGQIIITRATAEAKREQDRRSNASKPQKYLHFTLYKENTDSTAALRFIANQCGLSSKNFLFSGTKDKRAVTLQRVACKGLEPAKLDKINRMSVSRNGLVRVGDYTEKDTGLTLGSLSGNHFTIVLRIVDEETAESLKNGTYPIDLIQKTLCEKGFVNYFGPQRFGTTSVLTSDVGRLLLKGAYREAIVSILESRCEISPEAKPMLDAFNDLPSPQNFAVALSKAPQYCFMERDLLKFLVANPNSYMSAFSAMQRTSAMMYFHAVQSWFWNEWVSRRLSMRPLEPIVGDMVLIGGEEEATTTNAVDGGDEAGGSDEISPAFVSAHLSNIHIVTAEDVANKRFTIFDVVMTVPGCDPKLIYPQIEGFMTKEKLMAEVTAQGLASLFDPNCEMARQYHYYGTYRKVMIALKDFKLTVKTYSSPSEVLVETDLLKIKAQYDAEIKAKEEAKAAAAAAMVTATNTASETVGDDNAASVDASGATTTAPTPLTHRPPANLPSSSLVAGPVTNYTFGNINQNNMAFAPQTAAKQGVAVIAEFSLPAGAYATCVLREFCETVRGEQ